MRPLQIALTGALVIVAVTGCRPRTPPTARLALDCPTTQGGLTRSSVAPDGKSCLYASRDGDVVSLRLIPVTGTYQAALGTVEQELQALVLTDADIAKAKVSQAESTLKAAEADPKTAKAGAAVAAGAEKQAAEDALGDAKAGAPATKRNPTEDGAATSIDLPGLHIRADESGKADVNVGMIHVNAGDDGATVRLAREVRLRGEALSPDRRGFRATFILTRDNLKDGWRAVGYQAGGPKTGPITVAVVKSKLGDHDDILDDAKHLVRRNSGA